MTVGVLFLLSSFAALVRVTGKKAGATLFRWMTRMLGISLFLVQFLDWWQNSEEGKKPSAGSSSSRGPLSEQMVVQMDPKLCPVCKRPRKNDTVLSVSG